MAKRVASTECPRCEGYGYLEIDCQRPLVHRDPSECTCKPTVEECPSCASGKEAA